MQIAIKEENEVFIASLARWDTQLGKALSGPDAGSAITKRKTRNILVGMVVSKVGRRQGKSENVAKIGRIEGDKALE